MNANVNAPDHAVLLERLGWHQDGDCWINYRTREHIHIGSRPIKVTELVGIDAMLDALAYAGWTVKITALPGDIVNRRMVEGWHPAAPAEWSDQHGTPTTIGDDTWVTLGLFTVAYVDRFPRP